MIRGLFVNSQSVASSPIFAFMDEIVTWKTVGERVKKAKRGTMLRLAEALPMNASYLGRKFQGKGEPTASQLKTIERILAAAETAPAATGISETPATFRGFNRKVPVFGYAGGVGSDRIAFGPSDILDTVELPRGLEYREDMVIIRAIDSTMEPRIMAGEEVIVVRKVPPARDRDALIEFTDGTAVLKTYKGARAGRIYAWQWADDEGVDYDASQVKAIHAVFCRL